MAFNNRRGAPNNSINQIGTRRTNPPPIGNNFTPGGQLASQRPQGPGAGPRGPINNNQGANGKFRQQIPQQQQRMPNQMQQQRPVQQPQPPQPLLQQQQPQQVPPPSECKMETDTNPATIGEEGEKKRPFFAKNNPNKISKKERQRRRNMRLSKLLQPKNAVMILNELSQSVNYTITQYNVASGEVLSYTATVEVDGITHVGYGRSKMDAKNQAAESALKHIVKNRQFTVKTNTDSEGDEKMDETEFLPWQHVASFALYKLLNSWGEDPTQKRTASSQQDQPDRPQTKPAKKLPDNAIQMNPIMVLNQMLPNAQFEECERSAGPSNTTVFTFSCTVNGQQFLGSGSTKKAAKKMAAFAVCNNVLGLQYPPEIYTPPPV